MISPSPIFPLVRPVLKGAWAPLFDRLIDEDPTTTTELRVKQHLTKEELVQSVQTEIENLLNTRCVLKLEDYDFIEEYAGNDQEVLWEWGPMGYGLADFSLINVSATLSWDHLAEWIIYAIELHEPRLDNIQVTVKAFDKNQQQLAVSITGIIQVGEFKTSVNFPMQVQVQK